MHRRARLWCVLAFALMAAGLYAGTVRAEAFSSMDSGWEGCSVFASVLAAAVGKTNVVFTHEIRWDDLRPTDGLVLIHPTRAVSPDDLAAFLRSGGRAAVLDDYGAGDEILGKFRIRRIPGPQRPVRALRNNPALAIAEPVSDTSSPNRGISVHPTVASVVQLVTNHATGLEHPNLSPVLQIGARGEPDVVVAVAGQVERGRLLAVSDASVFINQMIRYPGNREFAAGIGRYLVDDDVWGTRGGRIYVVANDIVERGAYGDQKSFSRSLGSVFREFSGLLADLRTRGLPTSFAAAIGALAALVAVAWFAAVGARAYRRTPPRFARGMPLAAQGGVAGRAAVLAAPTTHRALAILELKSALEEAMAGRLGLEVPVSATALYERAAMKGSLNHGQLKSLKRLLFRMGMVETSVAAGNPGRIRDRDVESAAKLVHGLLEAMDSNAGTLPKGQDGK